MKGTFAYQMFTPARRNQVNELLPAITLHSFKLFVAMFSQVDGVSHNGVSPCFICGFSTCKRGSIAYKGYPGLVFSFCQVSRWGSRL